MDRGVSLGNGKIALAQPPDETADRGGADERVVFLRSDHSDAIFTVSGRRPFRWTKAAQPCRATALYGSRTWSRGANRSSEFPLESDFRNNMGHSETRAWRTWR
jgi:hypothetical protein